MQVNLALVKEALYLTMVRCHWQTDDCQFIHSLANTQVGRDFGACMIPTEHAGVVDQFQLLKLALLEIESIWEDELHIEHEFNEKDPPLLPRKNLSRSQKMQTWTIEEMRKYNPCYSNEQLAELWAGREALSIIDILELDIPDEDKIWACTRAGDHIPYFLERVVTRAITNYALECDIAEVRAWAAIWLSGADRTKSAANAAANAADTAAHAADTAAHAAYAAYAAAYAAADAAAYAAADAAADAADAADAAADAAAANAANAAANAAHAANAAANAAYAATALAANALDAERKNQINDMRLSIEI